MSTTRSRALPHATSVLAVCAHPDDESFGLGAVLHRFAAQGAALAVLCFTRGEASTLGVTHARLGEVRHAELTDAARMLGVGQVELLDHPDGSLASEPLDRLAEEVKLCARKVEADLVLVFDEGGVTGHPDHCRATEAAVAGVPALPVLAWAVPRRVADMLNAQFHTAFIGRSTEEIDVVVPVDRGAQSRAIACHASQCVDNPVLERRLALLGDAEYLRWLRTPTAAKSGGPDPAPPRGPDPAPPRGPDPAPLGPDPAPLTPTA